MTDIKQRVNTAHLEAVARAFHEAYERLAPDFGYKTREASAVPWEDVPENNRALMVATVKAVLDGRVAALPDADIEQRVAEALRGYPSAPTLISRLAADGLVVVDEDTLADALESIGSWDADGYPIAANAVIAALKEQDDD